MPEDQTEKIRRVYNDQKNRFGKAAHAGDPMTTSVRNAARLATAAIVGVPVAEVKSAIDATAGPRTTEQSGAPRPPQPPETDEQWLTKLEQTLSRTGHAVPSSVLTSDMAEPGIARVKIGGLDGSTFLFDREGGVLQYRRLGLTDSEAVNAFGNGARGILPHTHI